MNEYRYQGTITVFLSLVSVLFLSLVCTLVESARLQGARAWAAAVTDMGLFSVFGEYEKKILEEYDVLFLDGAYGTGDFEPERMALRMREFMRYNEEPATGMEMAAGINLFPMEMESCGITGYMLATDEEGSAFYQQVVGNIQENLGLELLLKYQQSMQEAQKQQKAAEAYEKKDGTAWDELEALEEQQEQSRETEAGGEPEMEEDGEPGTEAAEPGTRPETKAENPLEAIKKIKELGILGLVVKESASVSGKSVSKSQLPSGRKRNRGNLPVEKKYTGVTADGIFQEYLLEHFGTWRSPKKEGALEYQNEYILMGKSSDEENLKAVANRILLLREGINFLYILSDTKMKSQVTALAAGIAGAAPVPGLTAALEAVLMLAWAYGESLLDVRTLMSGGRVPAAKDASTWKLSLSNLARVTELLDECDDGGGTGQDYTDYLRILLFAGEKSRYPMRALDMMESGFASKEVRADAWVVKASVQADWKFPAIFLRVPEVFLSVSGQETGYEVTGSFGY